MDPKILAAIISSVISLIVALFSLIISRKLKLQVLMLEEKGKKSDQIRIKATDWGDKLVDLFGKLILTLGELQFTKRHEGKISSNDPKLFEIGEIQANISQTIYSSSIYIDTKLRNQIAEHMEIFTRGFDFNTIDQVISDTKMLHSNISEQIYHKFLAN
jgi:hypothetical protein